MCAHEILRGQSLPLLTTRNRSDCDCGFWLTIFNLIEAGMSSGSEPEPAVPAPGPPPAPRPSPAPVPNESPTTSRVTSSDIAALWLRRGDQLAVGLLVTALLVLLTIHWARQSRWGQRPIELSSQHPREYHYSLDINTASWVEWAQLDGIGETLAKRIIADREERGPFETPDHVGRVRGIGPKLLDRIRPYLRGGVTESSASTQLRSSP